MKKFADREELWGLYSEGWAMALLEQETVFPVWPEADFASFCATGDWSGYEPRRISVHEFVQKFLPNFENEGTLVGVFPRSSRGSVPLTPAQFNDFLQQELNAF